ncbi:hypothetical protein C5167_014679 [Papaver somniferum]|uniref:Uncharacterized protein n=1 Tax=Papaver somniferum TaxID=3469 RepID=A0A4Y7J3W0_PAPSO|nr:hypothetical protein C5167_014679 [Papaver somniferum]
MHMHGPNCSHDKVDKNNGGYGYVSAAQDPNMYPNQGYHLGTVIKSRIPGLQSIINKSIAELEAELSRFGKPVAFDGGGKLYLIMEICHLYDGIYKEHLDGIYVAGTTFFVVCEPGTQHMDALLDIIYEVLAKFIFIGGANLFSDDEPEHAAKGSIPTINEFPPIDEDTKTDEDHEKSSREHTGIEEDHKDDDHEDA